MPAAKRVPRWEHFHHDADIGVRGIGCTLEQAFEQAGQALTAVISKLDRVRETTSIALSCEAGDDELLFFEWLNAVIYEMATRRMLFRNYRVSIDGGRLKATLWGEPIDLDRHEPAVEIKGATFTALSVRRGRDGLWRAQCVVDV